MKRVTLLLSLIVITLAAQGQVRFGLRAGIAMNNLHFKSDMFSPSNRTNFTGGIMLEWETPLQGLALDFSALYAHRSVDLSDAEDYRYFRRDYIDLPLYIKFKFPIGEARKVTPFIFSGPDFAILVSKKKDDSLKQRFSSLSTSINVGAGIELFRHVQLSVAYSMGLNKSVKVQDPADLSKTVEGTDRTWLISAAYIF